MVGLELCSDGGGIELRARLRGASLNSWTDPGMSTCYTAPQKLWTHLGQSARPQGDSQAPSLPPGATPSPHPQELVHPWKEEAQGASPGGLEPSFLSSVDLVPGQGYTSCGGTLGSLSALGAALRFLPRPTQVDLPHKAIQEASRKKFEDALSLIHSSWQRSDSLCRGRASRDPWC